MTGPLPGAVRARLACLADPDLAGRQQAYMKSPLPFHGVPHPEVRRIVRVLLEEHPLPTRGAWEHAALELWDGAGAEFFVRKAVGWALRQHSRTDEAWVREYVASRQDRLSGLSRREALKHLAADPAGTDQTGTSSTAPTA